MIKTGTIALVTSLLLAPALHAADYMSADAVKATFTDKTFDGVYLAKDKHFSAYEAPDGTHHVVKKGKREKGRTWFVNDKGQHCTTNPKWKNKAKWKDGRCSHVVDAGNGEYHKINDDGKHTHTLMNFRDGDQL
jgi:hypothetical protein